ncbi:hypothetical protein D3C71_1409390 [compost metagenome]
MPGPNTNSGLEYQAPTCGTPSALVLVRMKLAFMSAVNALKAGRKGVGNGASAADIDTVCAPRARMDRPASISSWPFGEGASSRTGLFCCEALSASMMLPPAATARRMDG